MTPDEKKVLAEMLGLRIFKGKLIRLVPSLNSNATAGCSDCAVFNSNTATCSDHTYAGAGGCELDKIYVEWNDDTRREEGPG